ncbi:hypothetical protein, partial [Pantoea sp. R102]|uniref:hypothetical protein n=1 Tax=Pantoea sp. R102 TaxID=2507583 RepID=UPI001B3C571F
AVAVNGDPTKWGMLRDAQGCGRRERRPYKNGACCGMCRDAVMARFSVGCAFMRTAADTAFSQSSISFTLNDFLSIPPAARTVKRRALRLY